MPQILIILLGKKLILFPQTFGPFKGSFARRVARYIVKHCEFVYLRDKKSIDDARRLLPASQASKVRFCFDVGFLLKPEAKPDYDSAWIAAAKSNSRPLVGFNVSGLLYSGGYTGKNEFGLKADYRALVENMIDFLIREKSASVALVSHVQSEKSGTGPAEGDDAVCLEIFNRLQSKYPGQLFFAGADSLRRKSSTSSRSATSSPAPACTPASPLSRKASQRSPSPTATNSSASSRPSG